MKVILGVTRVRSFYFAETLHVHHRLLDGEVFCPSGSMNGARSGTYLQRDGAQFHFFFCTLRQHGNLIGERKTLPCNVDTYNYFQGMTTYAKAYIEVEYPQIDMTDARMGFDMQTGDIYVVFPNCAWIMLNDQGIVASSLRVPFKNTSDMSEVKREVAA